MAWIEFDQLWNYNQPQESEERFRALLPEVEHNPANKAELLTQMARALGLQGKFTEAHQALDEAKSLITAEMPRAQVRLALERGRAYNSGGDPQRARAFFEIAMELGQAAGEDFHTIDAVHMLGIVAPGEEGIQWNLHALELTKQTKDERAQKWTATLHNNLGWDYFNVQQYETAVSHFQQCRQWHEQHQNHQQALVARWSIARSWRAMGRVAEALAEQKALAEANKEHPDGFVFEEMGECLVALNQPEPAISAFAQAYYWLERNSWYVARRPERLQELRRLGQVTGIPLYVVTDSYPTEKGLTLLPGIPLRDPRPEVKLMTPNHSLLELRLPDGNVQEAVLVTFGISVTREGDDLILHGRVEDQLLHLTVPAEVGEIPAGTQVWLMDKKK